MTLSVARVFAEANALWRRERRLVVPLAGVFFFLPMLGIVLLLDRIDLAPDATPEQLRTALTAFYDANLLPLLLINLFVDFGTFALLNLFLQGNGRTLGEVLTIALRRFLPFLVIDIMAGLLLAIGASLFLLPGLFIYARTWLAAPALAAQPESGILGAARDGWMLSRGLAWVSMLATMAFVAVLAVLTVVLTAALFGALGMALGDAMVLPVIAYIACAAIGCAAWTALAVLRVATYRLARQGI